jgi:peptide/nickel transport system permease protein
MASEEIAFSPGRLAFRRLMRNPLGVVSMAYVLLVALMAIFAYALAPDHTPNANQMNLSLALQPPGTTVAMFDLPPYHPEKNKLRAFFTGDPNAQYMAVDTAFEENGQWLYFEYGDEERIIPKKIDLSEFETTPKLREHSYLLGTDRFGRDLWSRVLIGSRISITVGFIAVIISLLVGITLGSMAGYFGGKIDALIMWLVNVVWSIPTLLLVIAITLALGKGYWQVFLAVGLTMWVEVARVVRGEMMGLKEREFIEATKALGFQHFRTIRKHLLPNLWSPVIVISSANFAAAILVESGLSFLGIGAQPPTPSWGSMIRDHYAYIIMDKAYLAMAPGFAIMLLVLAFMLLGNALRDALEVRN